MDTFCITTDSVVDMTLERMEELEATFVPLHVHFGNEDFPDDMRPETTAYLFEQIDGLGSENFKIDIKNEHLKSWQATLFVQNSTQSYASSVLLKDL